MSNPTQLRVDRTPLHAILIFGVHWASFFFGTANAANLDLALTVSGSRTAAPKWQSAAGVDITTLDFAFSGAAGVAAANVDSTTVVAKLVNATSYPATIAVTVPATCTIGVSAVAPADIKVVFNAAIAAATLSIASNANQNLAIRFLAAGNYGDKVGAVACATAGQLRYTY